MINGRRPLVLFVFSTHCPIFLAMRCTAPCLCLPRAGCFLQLWADPGRLSVRGQTCTNLWRAISLTANKIEHSSANKMPFGATREPEADTGGTARARRGLGEQTQGGQSFTVATSKNQIILLHQPLFPLSLPKHHL